MRPTLYLLHHSRLHRLREAIRQKRRNYGPTTIGFCITIMHRLTRSALVLRDHFVKNSTDIVPQPPYLPGLAPCDFWLFPKLKRPLRGKRLESIDEIKAESKKALMAISEKDYLTFFENCKIHRYKCI